MECDDIEMDYKNAYDDGLRMFRATYTNNAEDEYFYCGEDVYNKNESDVILEAKQKTGTNYADIGWKECELFDIWEVDRTTECLNDVRQIY